MMRGFQPGHIKLLSILSVLEVFRMLGIFLVLPVFTVYGEQFTSSGLLIGIGLGSYGIAMAIFQIPMGMLSDRYGRKRVIALAMVPFIVGNLISWHPVTIFGLILGRFIAGAGAITSSSMALAQESVPESKRTAAMAFLGIPIGLSFLAGIVLGPVIGEFLGYSSIFLISALMGIAGLVPFLIMHIPATGRKIHYFKGKLSPDSILMGIVGLTTSFVLIAVFYFLPLYYGTGSFSRYEETLFITLMSGGIIAIALSPVAERGRRLKFALISLVLMSVSVPLILSVSLINTFSFILFPGLVIFFAGYSITEIVFTPIISTRVSGSDYGLNMGVYNTLQFIGQFLGGAVAGSVIGLDLSRAALERGIFIVELLMVISITLLFVVRSHGHNGKPDSANSKA